MKSCTYTIHLEPDDDGGWVVTVPSLPGCITQGETYEEALSRAEECIRGFLEALVKAGQPLPQEAEQRRPVEALVRVPMPVAA